MAAAVVGDEQELVELLKLQEEELQAQQDALISKLTALSEALGCDLEEAALLQLADSGAGLDSAVGSGELLGLQCQLAGIQILNDRAFAESFQACLGQVSPTAQPVSQLVQCLSCLDNFSELEMNCAGADAASSSSGSAGCGHYLCSSCLTAYTLSAVKSRQYPIYCSMAQPGVGGGSRRAAEEPKGCRVKFSTDAVLLALVKHPHYQQSYLLLEAQSCLDPHDLLYCPHKACSSPLLLEPGELPPDQPTSCPACGKALCPRCRIPGWHKGYTCAQFQALPAHLRSAEDAAVLQLSAKQQWKQCPQCQQMVERSEGCNHMLCRCGSNFCYKCGQPYKDSKPTAANVHGTPACGCPLFDVPE